MIKDLRRKFIAIAMGSMAAVLILLIGGMNIMNYRSMVADTDMRLNILEQNRGRFPVEFNKPIDGQKRNVNKDDFDEKPFKKELSMEAPFDTRFFTVVVKNDGSVVSVDTGKIAEVSTSDAIQYAQVLLNKHRTSGFVDNYRYSALSDTAFIAPDETMYIFLYCERELNSFKHSLLSSVLVSLLGMLLVFILVVIFSNILVKPVAESYEKQKRFITDAGHELKTPLTIIDANTEILEMTAGENEWTMSIHNQVRRLSSLTQKLVFLSRMDEGRTNTLNMMDFSLSDAAEDTAEPFKAVAETHNRILTLNIEPNLTMHGDEASIRQLLSILLDNAMKYSTENSEIIFSLKSNNKSKILTVRNATEDIPVGNPNQLFDRFYRMDSSHNSKTGGFGIGLSVAQAIVLAHKGKISAKSDDGRSIAFTVVLNV